jgi:hypothetical protein
MSKATFSFSSMAASALAKAACASAESAAIAGSTTLRQTLVFERVSGALARKSIQGARATQAEMTPALASARAKRRPLQGVEIVLDAQHRGRVDGLALEDALDQLSGLRHAKDLRNRPGRRVGFEPFDRARAQDDHAVRGLAAERLLPGEGGDVELRPVEVLRERGRRGVADRQARPVCRNPGAVGNANARRRAVPGEHDIVVEIDRGEIRQIAVGGLEGANVLELEFLENIRDPAFAEAFPRENVDAARAEQRPQRHFDGAGVRSRRDADAVAGGNAKNLACQIDGELEFALAELGAVRAAQCRVAEDFGGPSGALGARAGGKASVDRPCGGGRDRHAPSFQMEASRWGEVSRRRQYIRMAGLASG